MMISNANEKSALASLNHHERGSSNKNIQTERNKEQAFAIDMLMNRCRLYRLVVGSGKTLLAMAGLQQTLVCAQMRISLLVSRPVQPLGKDIGFLLNMEENASGCAYSG